MTGQRLLVPVSDSETVRQTVAYAVSEAFSDDQSDAETASDDRREPGDEVDAAADAADSSVVHFVVALQDTVDAPRGDGHEEASEDLLTRAAAWAEEDADGRDLTVRTDVLGTDEYLYGPRDFARTLTTYAADHDLERAIIDPAYRPGVHSPVLQSLELELDREGLDWEEAPIERPAEHERFVDSVNLARPATLFGISYVFYLVLGDPTYPFDLVTGAFVAGIVAITLSRVTFAVAPTLRRSPLRTVRFALYVPYLLYEIVLANLAISAVILRPSMPIDPSVTEVRARVPGGLPLTTLANSITLTPGTLTVRANDRRLVVHCLLSDARDDLFEGALERAVRFVFYGREAARIATPVERGDATVLDDETVFAGEES